MADTARNQPSMPIDVFRAFYESRPDEERWELIDGVAMMMASPTKAHQRIASNLEQLLNNALDRHNPSLVGYQRLGMNLRPIVENYDPEPDVVVLDADEKLDEHYADRFYLAAEVVSESDRTKVQLKRDVYRLHPNCIYIVTIRQDRHDIRIETRQGSEWLVQVLQRPTDIMTLPHFGLRCRIRDVYERTGVAGRPIRRPRR